MKARGSGRGYGSEGAQRRPQIRRDRDGAQRSQQDEYRAPTCPISGSLAMKAGQNAMDAVRGAWEFTPALCETYLGWLGEKRGGASAVNWVGHQIPGWYGFLRRSRSTNVCSVTGPCDLATRRERTASGWCRGIEFAAPRAGRALQARSRRTATPGSAQRCGLTRRWGGPVRRCPISRLGP